MTGLVDVLDAVLLALVLHTAVNALLLRRVPRDAVVDERVSVLLPVRDEAANLRRCLPSLLAQRGLSSYEVVVYDDGSTDGSGDVVRRLGGDRVTLLQGPQLPPGWLGKPFACSRLGDVAAGTVLVFVDADVVLAPDAVAGAVSLLRDRGWGFASPYPRQLAKSWLERLVQPLLQWSWLTFLPLRVSERSRRPSLVAANGQLLVVDADAYRRAGGHAAVHDQVVEDVALARRLRATGVRGGFCDGSRIATCRMYDSSRAVVDGYAKSLWTAFGSPAGGAAVAALLVVLGVVPWLLLAWTPVAWPAAALGPAGRLVTALRTGSRPTLDAVAHPLSVLAFAVLVVVSVGRRRAGRLQWKERSLS